MHLVQNLACRAVDRCLSGRNLNDILNDTWKNNPGLEAAQRAAVQDLSFGTLRHLGQLRAVLDQLVNRAPDRDIQMLLLVALYQLQYGKSAEYAVVDHAVELAGKLTNGKAGGFVNAILRRFLRERTQLLAQAASSEEGRYSYPRWWLLRVREDYPAQWSDLLLAGNQHPPMTLRVNLRQGNVDAYMQLLQEAGIAAQAIGHQAVRLQHPCPVSQLPGFDAGRVSVQDYGAQLAALALEAQAGERVLDACAAPGGKTGHILELADVELLALDHDASRLNRVSDNLRRLRLNATVQQGDASKPEGWWDGRPFDRILADVPCSASGVVRRHPDIKWLRQSNDVASFARQQAGMLDALWTCLKPGGTLLYASCSIFPQENRQQLVAFLQRTPDASCQALTFAGMVDGQLLPDQDHDGFYYARLRKQPA